jgi:neutral ceramidase
MSLLAGIARRSITPEKPLFLFGYPHTPRLSTGVHDPLYATALYLESTGVSALLVSIDVLMLSTAFMTACRQAIAGLTGIPLNSILISTTHTHSAPVTMDLLAFRGDSQVPPADRSYQALIHARVIEAALEARQQAAPAEVAFTRAWIEGVGSNRLSPDGPRDPYAHLMLIRQPSAPHPLAISLIYGMHPTVMHEDSTRVSADFPAYTRQALEQRFPGAVVLYQTGPAGNQSPRWHVKAQTFAEAERLGLKLSHLVSDSIINLSDSSYTSTVSLFCANRTASLPFKRFPPVPEAETHLQQVVDHYQELVRQDAPHGPRRTAEVAIFGAEELVVMAKAQESGELQALHNQYSQAEVQAICLLGASASHAFIGLPCEIFAEYGLEIQARAPFPASVISLANGELQGYIVTPGSTGYEASFSLFDPQAGSRMVETALDLLASLRPPSDLQEK